MSDLDSRDIRRYIFSMLYGIVAKYDIIAGSPTYRLAVELHRYGKYIVAGKSVIRYRI